MKELPEEIIWSFLLELKRRVKNHLKLELLMILYRDERFIIYFDEQPKFQKGDRLLVLSDNILIDNSSMTPMFLLNSHYSLILKTNNWLSVSNMAFLNLYLPFCFYPLKAFKEKRSITLLHFAQSLDGKIAANNGHSKWIGNTENQVHAHRLRALFDGILIGSNTLNVDQPKLTVRLVNGQSPVKVVVGNFQCDFNSLLEDHGKVIFVTSQDVCKNPAIEQIIIQRNGNSINPELILPELFKRDIYSLFIEGGAYTASLFLSAKSIDILQLFIAPRILGSGISCFSLKEIFNIDESTVFSSKSFIPMGDGILFSGEVKY